MKGVSKLLPLSLAEVYAPVIGFQPCGNRAGLASNRAEEENVRFLYPSGSKPAATRSLGSSARTRRAGRGTPTRTDPDRPEPHEGYVSRLLGPTLADLIRAPLAGIERGSRWQLAGGAIVAFLCMAGVR